MVKKITIGILLIVTIFLGYFNYQELPFIGKNKINSEVRDTKKNTVDTYNLKIKKLNSNDYQELLNKNNVSYNEKLNNARNNINQAYRIVYSNLNDSEYNKAKQKVNKLVGSELGKVLLSNAKPVINQTGKATSQYGGIKDLKVGFGNYNIDNNNVHVTVLVHYKQGKIYNGDGQEISRDGYDYYTFNYDVINQQATSVKYVAGRAGN